MVSQRALALVERVPHGGPEASLGFAALQALLPLAPDRWVEVNADRALGRGCAGKRVAVVGRFNFSSALRSRAASVSVIELDPRQGESAAQHACDILPQSDLIVINGMALVNRTREGLLAMCPPRSQVALVGPSARLSEVLFGYGIGPLCGGYVERPQRVMAGIRLEANLRQVHHRGTRRVTLER